MLVLQLVVNKFLCMFEGELYYMYTLLSEKVLFLLSNIYTQNKVYENLRCHNRTLRYL